MLFFSGENRTWCKKIVLGAKIIKKKKAFDDN